MVRPRRFIRVSLAAALLIVLAGCDQTPTGRSRLALILDDVLNDLGAQAFEQMKASQAVSDDPANDALAGCITDYIIDAARNRYSANLPASFEVVVFDNPSPNAFAMPGGKIGVHTGLIELAQSDAQLAAVLGHEVGHLIARHGNERMTQQLGVSVILLAVGFLAEIDSELVMQVLGMGAQVGVILPFSRAHETEADIIGLELMANAGFDPEESIALWQNMARAGGGEPLEFISTHPGHDTRIAGLEMNMARARGDYEQATPASCPG